MATNHFSRTGNIHPRKSAFDLSFRHLTTMKMGTLVPVCWKEMVPNETFKIGVESIVRLQPMIVPPLHEVDITFHAFYVPERLVESDWIRFITGGVDGQHVGILKTWQPTASDMEPGKLWDYFGFPITHYDPTVAAGLAPRSVLRRVYNLIWNDYYRDENYQARVGEGSPSNSDYNINLLDANSDVLQRAWKKDYFTSSLPFQQRGTPPAFPVSGLLPIVVNSSTAPSGTMYLSGAGSGTVGIPANANLTGQGGITIQGGSASGASAGNLYANMNNAVSFNMTDLRLAAQIQLWQELNARNGVRYPQFLTAHFDDAPRDETLQRPVYIGGSKSPVIISEVLNTSSGDSASPQANMAGHGIQAGGSSIGSYHSKEFGWMMILANIQPKPMYEDGIHRSMYRKSKLDFYFPEFAHLSEQAIFNAEIFAQGTDADDDIWSYIPVYDERRISHDMVTCEMRKNFPSPPPSGMGSLGYWHFGRSFTELPNMNEDFIKCSPTRDPFAVWDVNSNPCILNAQFYIRAVSPMPEISLPGRLDHVV